MIKNIIFAGNNQIAVDILKFLTRQKVNIVGLILHPNGFAKKKQELIEIGHFHKSKIFRGDEMNSRKVISAFNDLKPDLFLSINFRYLLKDEIIKIPKYGCINLHFGYLPFNRGVFADVFSIIEDTPAGVTYHLIDTGIDTGKIISQKEIKKTDIDTGKTLYQKLTIAAYDLFVKTWPQIKNWSFRPIKQSQNGTFHRRSDITSIDKIDLGKKYKAGDLINILRARTFPPYHGAYFLRPDGSKIHLRLKLYQSRSLIV